MSETIGVRKRIRIRFGKLFLLCLLTAVLMTVTDGKSKLIPDTVYAAKATMTIKFTDNSGKYMEKISGSWYLRSKNGKSLTGVQYLRIPRVGSLRTGYYMFDSKGKLLRKRSVYYFKNQKVNGTVFNGYHYTDGNGRFPASTKGIYYLTKRTYGNKTFQGFYYADPYGKLSAPAQLRYLKGKTENGVTFKTGYYYFDAYGKLTRKSGVKYLSAVTINGVKFPAGYYYVDSNGRVHTEKVIHKLSTRVGNVALKGNYCFGGSAGSLIRKKGWVKFNGKQYYLDAWGKIYTNCWVDGYYVQEDGTIARSKKLPDGSYVDAQGKKCTQEQFEMGSLKKELQNMVNGYSGTWSVYVKNLETGGTININECSMYPASTIKAFVMASTYDQINKGNLKETAQIQTLLKNMITVSDNESYNQLVRYQTASRSWTAGTAVVNKYLKANGYTKTGCHSSLHPAFSSYMSDGARNIASARDCGLLLEKIYNGTCVSKTYSDKMLNLLLNQTRRWKIPSGIPSGIKVANKTGETSTTQHDIAIVYGAKTDYIICVFSSGCSEYTGCAGIRSISSKVYNYLN